MIEQHTPGPWEIEEDDYGDEIWLGGDGCGMIVVNGWVNGGCMANPVEWAKLQADARLIAAAPDLLAALQVLFSDYKFLADSGDAGFWSLEDTDEGQQALAAIAKATGQ
jgi:hypothetical protein